ncbi:hypothetical protein ACJIZ3_006483 [Penstemon smallii]|uniref:Syntaxin N-terminal domain-containing protein n=1 Tax=Penstemon smallii TaxID=265156 RepID=A0ABD3S817_9LAMI
MGDSFDSSFKIYVDSRSHHSDDESVGGGGHGNDPNALDTFFKEIDKVNEDIKNMENLYIMLQESNEGVKAACSAKTMMELRTRIDMDLDHVLRLSKQINKKLDGLVRTNAAQRKVQGNGPCSTDDQTRASMISGLGENVNNMMRKFQGLRVRMETDHRQIIETRYFAITGEKATEEAIDHLISSQGADGLLYQAVQEHGTAAVMDAVTEIQERRDAMREIRKHLMNLHQILLGMASPVEAHGGRVVGGGPPSPVEVYVQQLPPATTNMHSAMKPGAGRLNDYEKETRRQAYIAMGIALVLSTIIIIMYLKYEGDENKDQPQ